MGLMRCEVLLPVVWTEGHMTRLSVHWRVCRRASWGREMRHLVRMVVDIDGHGAGIENGRVLGL